MILEKFDLIRAVFRPKNELIYTVEARIHIGKSFRWLLINSENVEDNNGNKIVYYFTPFDKGFESIPIVSMYELINIELIG